MWREATVKMMTRKARFPGNGSTSVITWASPAPVASSSIFSGARRRSATTTHIVNAMGMEAICSLGP